MTDKQWLLTAFMASTSLLMLSWLADGWLYVASISGAAVGYIGFAFFAGMHVCFLAMSDWLVKRGVAQYIEWPGGTRIQLVQDIMKGNNE